MEAITQAIVNKSKLEVSHIKITDATPEFVIPSLRFPEPTTHSL